MEDPDKKIKEIRKYFNDDFILNPTAGDHVLKCFEDVINATSPGKYNFSTTELPIQNLQGDMKKSNEEVVDTSSSKEKPESFLRKRDHDHPIKAPIDRLYAPTDDIAVQFREEIIDRFGKRSKLSETSENIEIEKNSGRSIF